MRSRRLSPIPVLAVVAGVLLAGCGAQPAPANPVKDPNATRVSVAMVTHGQQSDPFWAQLRRGAEQAAHDFNVDLAYASPPTTDPAAQARLITDAAGRRPAAMVVTIPDPSVLTAPIRQASDGGIPVIVANVGLDQLDQAGGLTYVGQDEALAGREAATAMAQAGVTRALCVVHEPNNRALTDRCAGFAQQLPNAVQVLAVNGADQTGAQAAISAALTADPAINGVLATGIEGFAEAGAALTALNAAGRVKLGTFDVSVGNPDDLAAVRGGQALFVVDQQPFLQGYEAVQAAAFQARFGQHAFRPVFTGPSLVTTANVDKVAQLYQQLGAPRTRISVAMVTHGQDLDPFWAQVRQGAAQAAADFDVDLGYVNPSTTDPAEQARLIADAAARNPAALVVTIPDPAVLTAPIAQAASGRPVVVANVGLDQLAQVHGVTYVGQDEALAGQEAGTAMAQAGVKHALCVIHEQRNRALTDRCDGFGKQLTTSGGTVTVVNVDGTKLHDAQQAVAAALRNDPAVDGVLATGLQGFTATSGALRDLDAVGRVKLGVFDVSIPILTAVQNGQALFAVDQQPFLQGYDAVQVAAIEARYGQHPFQPVFTGPSLVTKDNAARVLQQYRSNPAVLVQQGGYPS